MNVKLESSAGRLNEEPSIATYAVEVAKQAGKSAWSSEKVEVNVVVVESATVGATKMLRHHSFAW